MNNQKVKLITILAILLCTAVVTLTVVWVTTQLRQNESSSVVIPGNIITIRPEKNKAFQVDNMFPGDSQTKNYQINVSYNGDITVRYHADIRPEYEKLAEVLKVKIRLLNTDELMYDGFMRDMPESLNHTLKTTEITQSKLDYEVTVYLDTSVGNEYQNCELKADFRWWVEEVEHLNPTTPSKSTSLFPWKNLDWSIIVLQILLILLIPFVQFYVRRKKVKK